MGLINALDCNKIDLGLGVVECERRLGQFQTPILVPKGWSVPLATIQALDFDGVVALVQAGTWQPILGSVEFTNNTPDVTTKEYTGGITAVIRNGKPQYTFEYDNGLGFHAALYSKNGFNKYDVLIADDAGTIVGATSADGLRFTALSASMVNTGTYVPVIGDDTAKSLLSIQLSNETQFNTRMATLTVGQSGVDINTEILAITGVTITATPTAGDPIPVVVNAVNNVAYGIEALTATNFRVVNTATNTVLPIASVAAGVNEGEYAITLTTPAGLVTGGTITIEVYDATVPTNVALVGENQLYKGKSSVLTVAA